MMQCSNPNCMSVPVICKNCGFGSEEDSNKLLCQLCHISQKGAEQDSEEENYDSLVAPKVSLEYSVSRDPSKLNQEGADQDEGGFKVGGDAAEE